MHSEALNERLQKIQTSATGRWSEILTGAGISDDFLRKKGRPCPLCGGTDRFAFYKEKPDGYWFCRGCGYGDGLKLLQLWRKEHFTETLAYLEHVLGLPTPEETPVKHTAKKGHGQSRQDKLQHLWDEAMPLDQLDATDPVIQYLRSRGLPQKSLELRSHPSLDYWETLDDGEKQCQQWPAMIARVTDDEGNLVSLHRTYLSDDGKKAPVDAPKKLFAGHADHGLVRLMPPGECLGFAEGIETALAAQVVWKIPVWSAISVGGFQKITELPDCVKKVIIFGDNDKSFVGQAGAWALAARLRRDFPQLGIRVEIPEVTGFDWNDVWMRRREGSRKPKKNNR